MGRLARVPTPVGRARAPHDARSRDQRASRRWPRHRRDTRGDRRCRRGAHARGAPSLVAQKVELETTGPGQLRGRLPWPADGAVVLRAKAQQQGQIIAQATKILDRPFAKEYSLGDDDDALRAIAQLSGGEQLEAANLARAATASGSRRMPLAPSLLAIAFLLFFVDLYIKRVRPTPQT